MKGHEMVVQGKRLYWQKMAVLKGRRYGARERSRSYYSRECKGYLPPNPQVVMHRRFIVKWE
jgi:hypothetical protein